MNYEIGLSLQPVVTESHVVQNCMHWHYLLTGACDGTLSCSTCHLVVDPEWFPKITDPLTEEEEDMLDLAYGLTDT